MSSCVRTNKRDNSCRRTAYVACLNRAFPIKPKCIWCKILTRSHWRMWMFYILTSSPTQRHAPHDTPRWLFFKYERFRIFDWCDINILINIKIRSPQGQWGAQALHIQSCINGLSEMNMVHGWFLICQNDVFPCQWPLLTLPSATSGLPPSFSRKEAYIKSAWATVKLFVLAHDILSLFFMRKIFSWK